MDNAKDIDVVMPMYNLKEYSNNFSKKLGILWQYYTNEPALTNAGAIDNFPANSVNNFPENCVISIAAANQETTFTITDTKLYVPIVTLSAQDNVKLLQQLKSWFKRTINWNKYQSKITTQISPNWYLDYLIHPSFQGVNRLFFNI